jgi:hypothetical protein
MSTDRKPPRPEAAPIRFMTLRELRTEGTRAPGHRARPRPRLVLRTLRA